MTSFWLIERAAVVEICWLTIERTSAAKRSGCGSSRQGPIRSMIAFRWGSTRRRCLTAAAQRSGEAGFAAPARLGTRRRLASFMSALGSGCEVAPCSCAYGSRNRYCGLASKVPLNPVGTIERLGKKRHRLVDALVGLSATEAQETPAGFAEALTPQACDAELIVGPFEQVVGQAVRGDLKSVADRANVGKDVKRAGRPRDPEPFDLLQAVAETLDLAAESVHVVVASRRCRARGPPGRPVVPAVECTRPTC